MEDDLQPGKTFYFIRHATPDWSRIDLPYHEPPGPPLTEQGQAESEALGEFLASIGVDLLYVSPLERCQHTARIVAQRTGSPLHIEERLIEWQPGEKPGDVRRRMLAFFDEINGDGDNSHQVGFVTHGGPIAMLLIALGMGDGALKSWRRFDHANPLPPAGVWRATRESKDAWGLELIFQPPVEAYDNLGVTRVSPSQ
jgi:broad specificity phosphatase PhoE